MDLISDKVLNINKGKCPKEFDKEMQEKKESYDLPKIDTYSTLSTFVKFLTKIPHQRKNAEKLII